MKKRVTQVCYKCAGEGKWIGSDSEGPWEVDPCPVCLGTCVNDLRSIELPANIVYSHEVVDAIDATEYNELTDAQKEGVQLLLMCGMVDLNVGKAGRVRLLNWFGGDSDTVANLMELVE